MNWFSRPPRYTTLNAPPPQKVEVPDGLWEQCDSCKELIYIKDLENNHKVCHKCGNYWVLTAQERLAMVTDDGVYEIHDSGLRSGDPLNFKGYATSLERSRQRTGQNEAIISVTTKIQGNQVNLVVFNFRFLGGSMGSVVGEGLTRAMERSLETRLPLVIISAGGGGARMHEGMLSLMQMAKTSAAVGRLREHCIPFISVLTHPTMGGVAASFAALGDVIIAEPGALIGFAGPRVIEQTTGKRLPEGFQTSEFLMAHGFIDMIVPRPAIKGAIAGLIEHLTAGNAA